MGIRASDTHSIMYSDVKVGKENRVGDDGFGFKFAMSTLDGGRIGIAAQALGIAAGAYELALKYAQERTTFGKPIMTHQAISFKLADMATEIAVSYTHLSTRKAIAQMCHTPHSLTLATERPGKCSTLSIRKAFTQMCHTPFALLRLSLCLSLFGFSLSTYAQEKPLVVSSASIFADMEMCIRDRNRVALTLLLSYSLTLSLSNSLTS